MYGRSHGRRHDFPASNISLRIVYDIASGQKLRILEERTRMRISNIKYHSHKCTQIGLIKEIDKYNIESRREALLSGRHPTISSYTLLVILNLLNLKFFR